MSVIWTIVLAFIKSLLGLGSSEVNRARDRQAGADEARRMAAEDDARRAEEANEIRDDSALLTDDELLDGLRHPSRRRDRSN